MSLAAILNRADPQLVELYGVGTDGWPYVITQSAPGTWGNEMWYYLGPFTADRKYRPKLVSRLAAALNQNGCIEVFGLDAELRLRSIVQSSPGNWAGSRWRELGIVGISAPAVGMNLDGTLQVFVVGTDMVIQWVRQSAPGDWEDPKREVLGNVWFSDPAVTSIGNCLNVFSLGQNSTVYQMAQTAPNGTDFTTNGLFSSNAGAPAAVVDASGTMALFTLGVDLHLRYANSSGGSYAEWGGTSTSDPVSVLVGGELETFLLGDNSQLYCFRDPQSPNPTTRLGGIWTADPAVVVNGAKNAELFAIGDDSKVYTLAQTSPGVWPADPGWTRLDKSAPIQNENGLRVRGRSLGLL